MTPPRRKPAPKTSGCAAQVQFIHDALQSVDKDAPTYPLWVGLVQFLSSQCEDTQELKIAVRGDGNGNQGVLQRLTAVEGSTKVIQSDVRHVLNAMRYQFENVDIEMDDETGEVKRIQKRKREDKQELSTSDRLLKYIVERIVPPVIVWLILGGLALAVAINEHLILAVPKWIAAMRERPRLRAKALVRHHPWGKHTGGIVSIGAFQVKRRNSNGRQKRL